MRPGSGTIEWGGFGFGLGIGEWFVITLLWGLIVVGLALLIQRVWDWARSAERVGLGTGPRAPILLQFQAQEHAMNPTVSPANIATLQVSPPWEHFDAETRAPVNQAITA